MKKLLLLFFFFQTFYSFGQGLTIGQVYDYLPGDVFQTEFNWGTLYPTFNTDSILSRTVSAAADTIHYTLKRISYTLAGPMAPPVYSIVIDTIVYTNLNSPASHMSYASCSPTFDTIDSSAVSSYCGRIIWQRFSTDDTSCFEPPLWHSDLVKGCGGPYYYIMDPSIPGGMRNTLTFYRKGSDSCGIFAAIPTGIPEILRTEKLTIFPNPSEQSINIKGVNGIINYEVLNSLGMTVAVGNQTKDIDISFLKSGIYFIRMRTEGNKISSLSFIRN